MIDDDDEPWTFHVPEVSREFGHAIGKFFVAWGVLEGELDSTFAIVFRTDPTLACCLYANLATKAKLDILTSAITMWKKALSKDLFRDCIELLKSARHYSETSRNVLAHVQPFTVGGSAEGQARWQFARSVARSEHEFVYYPTSTKHWRHEAAAVLDLARHWHAVRSKLHLYLQRLTPEQVDEICVSSAREVQPRHLRDHAAHTPRKKRNGAREMKTT